MTSTVHAGPREPGSFSLVWALIVSIALHVVLVLISFWAPLTRSAAVRVEADEQTIEFSFVQPRDTSADEPASDLPPPPSRPTPSAIPDLAQRGRPELQPPPSPVEVPNDARPPVAQPTERSPAEPRSAADAREQFAERDDPPSEDPSGAEHPADESVASMREARPASPPRSLDVNSALRDFGRAMSRRPPPPPSAAAPPSQGGGTTERNVFVPDLSALPTTGFGMGNLRFESTDFDWNDYGRQIYMAIWRAWHNRLYMTTNEFEKWAFATRRWYLDHRAAVRFTIQRNGQVTDIVVEAESGCLPLDQSAVDALDEVLLPPLPAAFPRERETVHARFITIGDVRDMKSMLGRMKAAGYF